MVAFKEKRTPPLKPTKPSPVSESSHSSENYACLFSLTLGWYKPTRCIAKLGTHIQFTRAQKWDEFKKPCKIQQLCLKTASVMTLVFQNFAWWVISYSMKFSRAQIFANPHKTIKLQNLWVGTC